MSTAPTSTSWLPLDDQSVDCDVCDRPAELVSIDGSERLCRLDWSGLAWRHRLMVVPA